MLAARLGAAFEGSGRRALRLLLQRETAPLAAQQQWAALLGLMHAHPVSNRCRPRGPPSLVLIPFVGLQGWYEWLDNSDLLVKRVLDILENGKRFDRPSALRTEDITCAV